MRFVLAIAIVMLFFLGVLPVEAAQLDLFQDNFTSGNWNNKWTPESNSGGLYITQYPGYLWLTVHADQPGILTNPHPPRLIANSSLPILSIRTPDAFFFFVQFRLFPFNMTYDTAQNNRTAEVEFGLRTALGNSSNYIAFHLVQGDLASGALKFARQAIYLSILKPMPNILNCIDSTVGPLITPPNTHLSCTPSILYNPGTGPFDLNGLHNFNIEGKVWPSGSVSPDPSWIAFNVDTNAWVNITQAACRCINDPVGTYSSMYPFIGIFASNAGTYTQSIATYVNLVQVSNYAPPNLQFADYVTNSCFGSCGNTNTNFLQGFARSLGFGDIVVGGVVLTTVILAATVVATGVSLRDEKGQLHVPGLLFIAETMGILVFFYITVGLPTIFMALGVSLSMAVGLGLSKGQIKQ